MPKLSKYTQRSNEANREPFVIEFDPEDGRDNIALPIPDGETIMQAEESATTRRLLRVLCGDQFDAVADVVADMDAEGFVEFVRDIARHYGISPDQVPEGKPPR